MGSQHRKNPWHRGYGSRCGAGLKIGTRTCTCVTRDRDTAVLPAPVLHPNDDKLLDN